MKAKILQALKTKFKDLGFGEKAFEGVADYLATTVTDEANIETAISGVEPMLKSFQGEVDQRVTSAVAKAKAEAKPAEGKPGEQKPAESKPGDDTPAWAKALIEQNKAMADRLAAIESGKIADSRKAQLEAKLKDANPKFRERVLKDFSRMTFKDEEEFGAYLTETEADAAEFLQQEANKGLGALGKPPVAGVTGAKAVDADIASWAASREPKKVEPQKS
jgi:hypothetical protein